MRLCKRDQLLKSNCIKGTQSQFIARFWKSQHISIIGSCTIMVLFRRAVLDKWLEPTRKRGWLTIGRMETDCTVPRKVRSSWYPIQTMADIGDVLWSPANIKGANKDAKIYVGRSTTVQNLLLCAHTLCKNYVSKPFLLVGSPLRNEQRSCFVHEQGQRTLSGFITISL